jgi:hypothetical protein
MEDPPSVRFVFGREHFYRHVSSAEFKAYYAGFSPMDRQVRRPSGVYSPETYINAIVPRSGVQKDALAGIDREVGRAHQRLARYAAGLRKTDAVRRLVEAGRDVPWVIALLEDRAEGAMPHTHGRLIALPFKMAMTSQGTERFVQTLIHERIHVLQRMHPRLARRVVYERLHLLPAMKRRDLEPFLRNQWRSNPDLDSNVYTDGVLAVFSENATSLGDIRLIRLFRRGLPEAPKQSAAESEHPFETIAYSVAAAAANKRE